jgi:hypothetical protein
MNTSDISLILKSKGFWVAWLLAFHIYYILGLMASVMRSHMRMSLTRKLESQYLSRGCPLSGQEYFLGQVGPQKEKEKELKAHPIKTGYVIVGIQ